MVKTLIVASKVKELAYVEGKQICVNTEFVPALEQAVKKMIAGACIRARENGRTTIMPRDIIGSE